MWIEKYKPKNLEDFVGNRLAVTKIEKWFSKFKEQKKKALFIEGPNGVGKTLLVELLAKKLNYNVIVIDSSEKRNEKSIKEQYSLSSSQGSLFFKGRVFLFDEMEALSGLRDRGASKAILDIIKETKHPVVITTSDGNDSKIKGLKTSSEVVKMEPIGTHDIVNFLKGILNEEKIQYDEKVVTQIARSSGGDLRSALLDMEILSALKELKYEDLKEYEGRDVKQKLKEVLMIVLKTKSLSNALKSTENASFDQNEFLEWIRENIPYEYRKNKDLAEAYYYISKGDIFNNRIIRRQYWRYLVYVYGLLAGGVAVSKQEKYTGMPKLNYPEKIKMLSILKFKKAEENQIKKELSRDLHCSFKKMRYYDGLIHRMRETGIM